MVLEQIYSVNFIREKPIYALLLGISYSLIGVGAALLMFPEDPAIVIISITSILFLPSLYKLAVIEEKELSKEKDFNLIGILRKQKQFIKVYIYAFFGIFIVFAFFSLILPKLATGHLFREQLNIMSSVGHATFTEGLFTGILINNIKIFLLCFLVSVVLGNGAIFLITWNASVWGTIFGVLAKNASLAMGKNPFVYLSLILILIGLLFSRVLLVNCKIISETFIYINYRSI